MTNTPGPDYDFSITTPKNHIVLTVGDKSEIEKYLKASEEYLQKATHRRTMKYHWPNLKLRCLLCGRPGCAIYKGYYTRLIFCPEMEFIGKIAIRTAYCKSRQERFSLCPDFIIPRLRITQVSLDRFRSIYSYNNENLTKSIDSLTEGLGEEFYMARSTAMSWLNRSISKPP